jgi:hypothetical protein
MTLLVRAVRSVTSPPLHIVTRIKYQVGDIGTKLYVGNLSYSTTEDDLRALFAQAGVVISVSLIKDRDSGRSKGFACGDGKRSRSEKAIAQFNGIVIQ